MRSNDDLKPPPNVVGKCLWAFITLIMPEFVSTIALHQYYTTQKFCQHVNESSESGKVIGMMQAFYATMGGIAHVNFDGGRVQPTEGWDLEMGRLTPLRFDKPLKEEWMELIRNFSTVEVEIRSKQDVLAKVLVCSQAGWVLVQCLARKIQALPITPLELHTALYIVNLMFMYASWLQKPVDLGRPILMSFLSGSSHPVSIVVNQDIEPEVPRAISDVVSTLSRIMRSLKIVSEGVREIYSDTELDNNDHMQLNDIDHMGLWESLNVALDNARELKMPILIGGPDDNISNALEIALREMTKGTYQYLLPSKYLLVKLTPC